MAPRPLRPIFYLLSYAAVVVIFFYVCYLIYMVKLKKESRDADIPIDPYIGWVITDKDDSFVHYPYKKPEPDRLRIGCFGDSLVNGTEVNALCDYPALLQGLAAGNDLKGAQFINFGMGYQGLQQNFLTLDKYGSAYDIDWVVVGPDAFTLEEVARRDSTFNQTFSYRYTSCSPSYFHSRYILQDNRLTRVDVYGDNPEQIKRGYFSFVPRWRYLRYDTLAPSFLRGVMAVCFPGKWIKNPFYYQKDAQKEMLDIYRILLAQTARKYSKVFFLSYDKQLVELARQVGADNLRTALLWRQSSFPYLAPDAHASPSGNLLLARQVAAILRGSPGVALDVLKISDSVSTSAVPGFVRRPLSEYASVFFEIAGKPIGMFINLKFDLYRDYCDGPTCRVCVNSLEGVKALLWLENPGRGFFDSIFLPLPFDVRDGMKVDLVVKHGAGEKVFTLGTTSLLHSGVNIAMVRLVDKVPFPYDDHGAVVRVNSPLELSSSKKVAEELDIRAGEELAVLLDGVEIMRGRARLTSVFKMDLFCQTGKIILIRANGTGLVDPATLPDEGDVDMVFVEKTGKVVKLPVARWRKTSAYHAF